MTSPSIQQNDDLALSLPIAAIAFQIAEQFAQAEPDPVRAQAIRLNTLAVCAVHDYCQLMAIPTDLESSDSWNPLMHSLSDVADLMLPDLGQLECRPVLPEATVCPIPPEVWDLRVGYVVVAIAEADQTAHLLGFVPTVDTEVLPLSQLRPLEDLLDHLYALQTAAVPNTAARENGPASLTRGAVNLRQWFNASFEAGWQAVEDLLSPDALTPALSFRGPLETQSNTPERVTGATQEPDVRRAKLIDLALQLGTQQVVLVVEMQVESPQATNFSLQVHPVDGQPYLPTGLVMAVLESGDEVFMQVQSRQADNYIQLQFTGVPGESFQVRLTLENAYYVETFVI